MNRRTRLLTSLLLLTVFVGVPVLLTWRAVRQERLERALIVALNNNEADTAIAALKAGAAANARDNRKENVSAWKYLRRICYRIQGKREQTGKEGLPALLLALGITRPIYIDGYRCPAPNVRLIAALLEAGADPNTKEAGGETALTVAAEYDEPDVIRMLLRRGADVNVQNKEGQTALIIAIKYGNNQVARLLIESHANVNLKDTFGDTALSFALSHSDIPNNQQMVLLLKQAGAKE